MSEKQRKRIVNQPILEAMLSNDLQNKCGIAGGNAQDGMRHSGSGIQNTKTYIRDAATVFDLLQVDPEKHSILEIFNKAAKQVSGQFQKLSPSQRFLHSLIGNSQYDAYCELLEKEEQELHETKKKSPNQESEFVLLPPHFRSDFNKAKNTEDKVNIAIAAVKEADSQRANGKLLQIGNDKSPDYYVLLRYRKIVDCLNTCFRGDITRFCNKCPKLTSKFGCVGRTKIRYFHFVKSTK